MVSQTRIVAAALVALVASALVGCVQVTPTVSGGTISTPTDSPTATVSPAPTPTAGTPAKPIDIACNTLVSLQTMYDFNPNFTYQASYAPTAGTAAYAAAADHGTACNWINNTSGDTVTISVAEPGSVEFAALKSSASSGTPVSGYGDSGFFAKGEFQVFIGGFWVVAQSDYFGSASDGSALMKSALAALPAG